MNEQYQYSLLPFVDDLIADYGYHVTVDHLTKPVLIELTTEYYKARGCASYDVLNAFIQDRANELYHRRLQEKGAKLRHHADNGEPYYA